MQNPNLLSTKFLVTVFILVSVFALFWGGKISQEFYATVTIGIAVSYGIINVADKKVINQGTLDQEYLDIIDGNAKQEETKPVETIPSQG